jgi:hypothetical protein
MLMTFLGLHLCNPGKVQEMTSRTERLAHDLASTREMNENEVLRLGSLIENKVINENSVAHSCNACSAGPGFRWL